MGTKQVTSPMCLSDANLPIYSEVTQFLKLKSHFLFARTGVSIFACLNGSNYVYFFTENFRPVRYHFFHTNQCELLHYYILDHVRSQGVKMVALKAKVSFPFQLQEGTVYWSCKICKKYEVFKNYA